MPSLFRENILPQFVLPKPVPIIEFCESDEYCGGGMPPLYPPQRVFLKLLFLEEMEGWEEDILSSWIRGDDAVVISPKIRERRDWLRENGFPHFREVINIIGRRGSKNHMTGAAQAHQIYRLQQLPDPGAYYGIPSDKQIIFACVAPRFETARDQQFEDTASWVKACKPLTRPGGPIGRFLTDEFGIHTAADIRLKRELKNAGIPISGDWSKLICKPLPGTASALRGKAMISIVYDEFAFMTGVEGRASAEQVAQAGNPAIRQFGREGFIFYNSTPWTMTGEFYKRYEAAMALEEEEPAYLQMMTIKAPAWAAFRFWRKDSKKRFQFPLLVSPDDDPNNADGEGAPMNEEERARWQIAKEEERLDPKKYAVETRSEWQTTEDAFLDPGAIERAFQPLSIPSLDFYREFKQTHANNYQFLYSGHCFSGDTRIITEFGRFRLDELVGKKDLRVLSSSEWRPAEVKSYGNQPILSVHVERNGIKKTIRATPHHVWRVLEKPNWKLSRYLYTKERLTSELKSGDILDFTGNHNRSSWGIISPAGIAHGFCMGDGSGERVYVQTPKDEPLLPYFYGYEFAWEDEKKRWRATGAPLFYKKTPPITESLPYLRGWLAGYFAADGTVSSVGRCTITSVDRENLESVKDVCERLGIFTYGITEHTRPNSFNGRDFTAYRIQLSKEDLFPEFFLLPKHRRRFENNPATPSPHKKAWKVVFVEDLGEEEEVFCAEVPSRHTFALEDHIHVHNCDPSSTTAGYGMALGHLEYIPDPNRPDEIVPHVVFDQVRRWNPADFPNHTIDPIIVQREILEVIKWFKPVTFTMDQYESSMPLAFLRQELRKIGNTCHVYEQTFTAAKNYKRAMTFRTALNLGLVHIPRDCGEKIPESNKDGWGVWHTYSEFAKLELQFLEERNGKVDKPTTGIIRTKDCADCLMEVTAHLIGDWLAERESALNESLKMGAQGGYAIGGRNEGGPYAGGDSYTGPFIPAGVPEGFRAAPAVLNNPTTGIVRNKRRQRY